MEKSIITLEQIKDEIRSLRSSERIELYKWLDYGVVADYGVATDFCPRIGMDRSLEIRHAIEQSSQGHTNSEKKISLGNVGSPSPPTLFGRDWRRSRPAARRSAIRYRRDLLR